MDRVSEESVERRGAEEKQRAAEIEGIASDATSPEEKGGTLIKWTRIEPRIVMHLHSACASIVEHFRSYAVATKEIPKSNSIRERSEAQRVT